MYIYIYNINICSYIIYKPRPSKGCQNVVFFKVAIFSTIPLARSTKVCLFCIWVPNLDFLVFQPSTTIGIKIYFCWRNYTHILRVACLVRGKKCQTYSPQMVVKNGDESHGRIRKKSPTKQTKVYLGLPPPLPGFQWQMKV